ncbi:phage major capsid protein [Mycolicibacterium sp. P9-64]|uniref:phage major capsid protein n=1 Tax=Mycolicibacterium sp. P9-64 TaxID=2024612 RepID=UPI0011ECF927|nr:phage major capsid protein [Mycolicibacterium sp. P9-64]KAA0083271.1 phage major capsid protein [Mycolicibacterium sp. P9-64]
MAIETTSGNSTLLQSQVASLLIQPLETASTFLASGVQIIDSSSPVRIPRITNGVTAGFVAEGAQISDGDVAFDELTLLPSSLKSLKVLVKFSNELLRQSVIGLDAVLKTRLTADVANALDAALYSGAGTSNTIKGVTAQTGIGTGVLDVTDLNSILDGIATAYAANVTPNRIYLNPTDWIALRKIVRGTGDAGYVLEPDAHAADSFALFGLPVTVTNHLAVGKAIIADTNHIVVVRDLDASVFLIDQLYADYDTQALRVVSRWDVGLTRAAAVTVLTATP